MLGGRVGPDQLPAMQRDPDAVGLTLGTTALLRAATQTDSLLPLLELLEPAQGESKIDILIETLERIAETQLRLEEKLDRIVAGMAKSS